MIFRLFQISEGKIPKTIVSEFIRPFAVHLAANNDPRLIKHIVKNIFRYLIFQSDVGMEYTDKFNAWREVRTIFYYPYWTNFM